MELRIIFSMLSMLSSGIFHTDNIWPFLFNTALPASLGEAAAVSVTTRLSRPKRCSCATFLDKECVYFCHLDIIWVNTPERTVSYGLGKAPRQKRSAHQTSPAAELPRCECTESTDGSCVSFCRTSSPLRRKATRDKVIPTAGGSAGEKCRNDLAAKTSGIKR
ncbi:hypothetical protein QTP86_027466 [Hemibagrus guttatus]|nr:hypothetical protein QTP86_027466 [Hemibagrus guttatus]